jgi:hypothetical protein
MNGISALIKKKAPPPELSLPLSVMRIQQKINPVQPARWSSQNLTMLVPCSDFQPPKLKKFSRNKFLTKFFNGYS